MVFFFVFQQLFVKEGLYEYVFVFAFMFYGFNFWLIRSGRYSIAYLLFMFTSCALLFCFDSGINSPIHAYIYYIPLFLCNFIVVDPENKLLRISALILTVTTLVFTFFFEFTPQWSLILFPPQYHGFLSYFNVLTAIFATALMIGIIMKISTKSELEMLKKQHVLISKEHLIHSINQNISEGLYRTNNVTNEFLYVNQSFSRLFGYEIEEAMMRIRMEDLYVDPKQRIRLIKKANEQGNLTNEEIRFLRRNGEEFWGLLSCVITRDEEGHEYCDGAIRDITHIKEIEQEEALARQMTEQASLAKSKFLSAMSHEIRTPMNAVIGIANLLNMNQHASELEKEQLQILKSSAENLMNLLNDLLDMGKIEAGKFELNSSFTDLQPAFDEIVNMYAFLAGQKGVKFINNVHLEDYALLIDKVRLMQVLSNLLSNAVKFTNSGYIKLNVGMVKQEGELCKVRFAVEDTGIGISKAYQAQIFTAFAQGREDIPLLYGGTGLGLAISRNIIRKMDSEIEVYSDEGKGAVFTFEIVTQCKKQERHQQPSNLHYDKNALHGLRVLLAEDNPVNVSIARQLLERWGIQVKVVSNGLEAVEHIQNQKADVVLMDLHMPEMDGFEATKKIRELGIQIPIIALTADALYDSKTQGLSIGMNDYITKPFNPEELYTKLFTFCRSHN